MSVRTQLSAFRRSSVAGPCERAGCYSSAFRTSRNGLHAFMQPCAFSARGISPGNDTRTRRRRVASRLCSEAGLHGPGCDVPGDSRQRDTQRQPICKRLCAVISRCRCSRSVLEFVSQPRRSMWMRATTGAAIDALTIDTFGTVVRSDDGTAGALVESDDMRRPSVEYWCSDLQPIMDGEPTSACACERARHAQRHAAAERIQAVRRGWIIRQQRATAMPQHCLDASDAQQDGLSHTGAPAFIFRIFR